MEEHDDYEELELGPLLRRLRGEASLRDVHRLTGISSPYLSQIERGERRPGPNLLKRLATLYGVDAYRLLQRAGHLGAGWTGDDPKADEPIEVERAYQYVLSDPMFRVGAKPDGPLSLNTKRFIVEMYEHFTGKRLAD